MRGEKFKRGGREKCDSQDAQTREHLHRTSAFDEQKQAINDKRHDPHVQQVDQPQTGL